MKKSIRTTKTASKKVAKVAKVAKAEKVAKVATLRPTASKDAPKHRGRVAKIAANKFLPTPDVKKANPRRNGSAGWKSLEIVRKRPGLSYAEFVAAGGRPVDLRWDIEHKHVVTK